METVERTVPESISLWSEHTPKTPKSRRQHHCPQRLDYAAEHTEIHNHSVLDHISSNVPKIRAVKFSKAVWR